MHPGLLTIVPTRGRPESVPRLAKAWRDTDAPADAELLLAVDDDDPALTDYLDAVRAEGSPAWLRIETYGEWQPMVPKLNAAAADNANSYTALGYAGDDHVPRTAGWAAAYRRELAILGVGIVYGDDAPDGVGDVGDDRQASRTDGPGAGRTPLLQRLDQASRGGRGMPAVPAVCADRAHAPRRRESRHGRRVRSREQPGAVRPRRPDVREVEEVRSAERRGRRACPARGGGGCPLASSTGDDAGRFPFAGVRRTHTVVSGPRREAARRTRTPCRVRPAAATMPATCVP